MTRVRTVANPANANAMAAVLAPQVVALAADYTHVLGAVDDLRQGPDALRRRAARRGHGQRHHEGATARTRFERPIYAGNAIITVECPAARKVVATVRNASFAAAGNGASAAPVEAASVSATLPTHTRYVELKAGRPTAPTCSRARARGLRRPRAWARPRTSP